MSESDLAKIGPNDGDMGPFVSIPARPKRMISQTTLSTLGEISVAVTDSIGPAQPIPRATSWLPILGFFLLVYFATCLAALFSFHLGPGVRALLTPLFPALVAAAAFGWRQRWKRRARGERLKSEAWRNTLGSLSHEVTSAANAMRANLTGFRLAHPQASQSELLNAIEQATARIDKAVQKANGLFILKNKVE